MYNRDKAHRDRAQTGHEGPNIYTKITKWNIVYRVFRGVKCFEGIDDEVWRGEAGGELCSPGESVLYTELDLHVGWVDFGMAILLTEMNNVHQ